MSAETNGSGEVQTRRRATRNLWQRILVPLMGLALIGSVFSGGAAAAAPGTENVHAATNCNGNATCDLDSTLSNIQYFLIGIGVLLAGVAFAVYGIQYLAGALDEMPPEKRFQRKKQFMEIMVGLVIVMMSAVLVTVAKGLIVTN